MPDDEAPDRRIPPPSPTVGFLAVLIAPLLVVVGLETVTHGQVSPGGGFQGGVVLASAIYVIYLATSYTNVERFEPGTLVEAADGVGAGGYVFIGVLGLLGGVAYLTNVVGLGRPGNLISGELCRCSTRSSAWRSRAGSFSWPRSSSTRPRSSGRQIVTVLAYGGRGLAASSSASTGWSAAAT